MTINERAGLKAGLSTVVLTTLVLFVGQLTGVFPSEMRLSAMAFFVDSQTATGVADLIGGFNHCVAGTIIGLAYGKFVPHFGVRSGVLFLMPVWLALMLLGLPLAGQGLFGIDNGPLLAIDTFVLHVAFGATMGALARRFRISQQSKLPH